MVEDRSSVSLTIRISPALMDSLEAYRVSLSTPARRGSLGEIARTALWEFVERHGIKTAEASSTPAI